ncbi:MAG: DNA mismatch repair endonuclease MutL [Candidatus Eisenbacteria bacterium]|nr:DNA mismatch repair endonuclease MutL [Candidatus Eisenbacteria bacterium]
MSESSIGTRPRVVRLDPRVVSKIAAGETIQRPSAAVKELVENAIDAGARSISVGVGESTDQWFEVADDGCGMSREELLLALEPHATSKLRTEEDLLAISTLGFRGEALPSIGRVSRLEVRTADDSGAGTKAVVQGGHLLFEEPIGRPRGTTVRVEDIFWNSPVRKRFLRAPQSEVRLVTRLLAATALAYPEIAFRLVHRGEPILELPAADGLENRLAQLHGATFSRKLLAIEGESSRGRVSGVVGVPELARPGTQQQTLLVNGRWVTAPWLALALRHGFGDLIPPQRNPFAVVRLDLDPSRVDVNVHPTKREVRFLDEQALFGDLVRAVRARLSDLVPTWSLEASDRGGAVPSRPEFWSREPAPIAHPRELLPLLHGLDPSGAEERMASGESSRPTFADESQAPLLGTEGRVSDGATLPPTQLVPLWQLHNRYIFAQTKHGLLVIDQHAAHERVLYERALRHLAETPAPTQQLLFPVVVQLEGEDWDAYREYHEDLARLGVDAEEFGHRTVLLRGVPSQWDRDPEGFFREILHEVANKTARSGEERLRQLAASYACRSAIKSGTALGLEEMNALIDQLFATDVPHGDPHGRPALIQVPLSDLDRRFGRH